MKLTALSIFFIALYSLVYAQEVLVRTGEHGEYTRVVFNFQDIEPNWTISTIESENFIEITVLPSSVSVNADRFFDRIGRQRVKSYSTEENKIQISLNCKCVYEADVYSGQYLVLDISEIVTTEISPRTEIEVVVEEEESIDLEEWIGRNFSSRKIYLEQVQLMEEPEDNGTSSANSTTLLRSNQVIDRIAASLNSGALVPSVLAERALNSDSSGMFDEKGLSSRANNGAIAARPPLGVSQDTQMFEEHCSKPIIPNFEDLPDIPSSRSQIIISPVDLYNELGSISEQVVINRINHLLSAGFGAEARHLMKVSGTEDPILRDISFIIDGEFPEGNTLSSYLYCENHVSLWSFLGERNLSGEISVNTSDLIEFFESLPGYLRVGLRRQFFDQLQAAGYSDEALSLSKRWARGEPERDPDILLMQSAAADALGDLGERQDVSNKVDLGDNIADVELLSFAIINKYENNLPIEVGDIENLAAFDNEIGYLDELGYVWYARFLGHISVGNFDRALNSLPSEEAGNLPFIQKARDEFLRVILDEASLYDFLRVLSVLEDRSITLDADSTFEILSRLVREKQFVIAEQFALTLEFQSLNEDTLLLIADAFLELGKYQMVEKVLEFLEPKMRRSHVAKLRLREGRYQEALDIYEASDLEGDREEFLWMAGDLEQLRRSRRSVLRDYAALATSDVIGLDDQDLSSFDLVKESSIQARSVIDDLLEEFSIPNE